MSLLTEPLKHNGFKKLLTDAGRRCCGMALQKRNYCTIWLHEFPFKPTMNAKSSSGGLVYSTDSGRMCPLCRQPVTACQCSSAKPRPVTDGIVRVSRETKGRAGKGVTLVKGLALDDAALIALGKQLKTACGSGGTVKDGVIEVQGDHCERVMALLQAKGLKVKRAGG